MVVPNITRVTVVSHANPIPIVTFLTSPASMTAPLTTVVRNVPPVKTTRIVVRRRFLVTMDVPRPTPVVSVPLVQAIRTAT